MPPTINFSLMQWELWVTGLTLALLLADLFIPTISKRKLGLLTILALGVLLIWSFFTPNITSRAETAWGFYVLDPLALWTKQFSILATILTIFMSIRFLDEKEEHFTEYILLQLFACLGMMLVGSSANFLSLFVSLELMTVAFYILTTFQRKSPSSLEAGLKYLIYGALSSGVMLYGIALIYGSTGQIHFNKIAMVASSITSPTLLFLGFILLFVGVAFKISAVPFHWWTPDVYEGSPIPTTALLSIGSKAAGFVFLIRVLTEAFPAFSSYQAHWFPLICLASGASILYGNTAALSQINLKRLMGYSSISHTGYMLLGVAAYSQLGLSAVFYYLLGYLFANALIFAVMCETHHENPHQEIRSYAGLGTRSPWAAAALAFGLLSLSGLPPFAGFFGKLLLFRASLEKLQAQTGFLYLLIIAVIGVVCSLYYYLNVLRTVYSSDISPTTTPLPLTRSVRWTLGLLMAGVLIIGFYQSPWWEASVKLVKGLHI